MNPDQHVKTMKPTSHAVIMLGVLALGCLGTVGGVRAEEKPPIPDFT